MDAKSCTDQDVNNWIFTFANLYYVLQTYTYLILNDGNSK